MKFWELLRQPPRPRDPVTGAFLKQRQDALLSIDERVRALAKSTDHLPLEVKKLAKLLAESDLTTAEIKTLISKHYERDSIMQGYSALVKAMQLRPGSRSKAFLARKGEV